MDILQHLLKRGLNPMLYPQARTDGRVVLFPLYDFAGRRTGYIKYNPDGPKNGKNPKDGKYFTYIGEGQVGLFGCESLTQPGPIFLTGGLFKATTLHRLGYAALHVSSISPRVLKPQLRLLQRPFYALGDNDAEGHAFVRRYGGTVCPMDVDEMTDKAILKLLEPMLNATKLY